MKSWGFYELNKFKAHLPEEGGGMACFKPQGSPGVGARLMPLVKSYCQVSQFICLVARDKFTPLMYFQFWGT